jgi:hypothetical protein
LHANLSQNVSQDKKENRGWRADDVVNPKMVNSFPSQSAKPF